MTRVSRWVGDGLMVVLLLLFAFRNLQAWRHTHGPVGLGVTAIEVLTAVLFVSRRRPLAVTGARLAWPAAAAGSFLMLLARPAHGGTSSLAAEVLQLLGFALAATSLGVLGRSFGFVAANRGVKTSGAYALVRHPAYVGYLVGWAGYVAENPRPLNVALFTIALCAQLVRIAQEESVLRGDDRYRAYAERVRYRLVPFVY